MAKKTKEISTERKVKILNGPEEKIIDDKSLQKEDLFDFIKTMFSNKKEFLKKTNHERGKYAFMINRFGAIQYPKLAAMLSKISINQGNVVTYWFYRLYQYTKTPNWMYVSTAKAKEEKRKKNFDIKQETIKMYCKLYEIDLKTFEETKERYNDELLLELKELEKSLNL